MHRICLVTGSRAEYGIMQTLMRRLDEDDTIALDVVVTGMHMEEKFGNTYRQIEADGFTIAHKIPIELIDTSKKTVVNSMSRLQSALNDIFDHQSYDLIVILGDRYEMLPVATTALIYNIPICHLHGGETSLGNYDEYIRHALTKMSQLHLVATEQFKQRIIQMGEQPEFVIHTGSLGVENALAIEPLTRRQLEQALDVELADDYVVVLYHPETFEAGLAVGEQMKIVLSALADTQLQCIFIGSNADTGSDEIAQAVTTFVQQHKQHYQFHSLSMQQFHSLVRHARGLVGNSSSGLIEVPSLNRPTLNIGDRQKGRLAGPSVIHVPVNEQAIIDGIERMKTVVHFTNPYERAQASLTAYEAIKGYLASRPALAQPFYDGYEVMKT